MAGSKSHIHKGRKSAHNHKPIRTCIKLMQIKHNVDIMNIKKPCSVNMIKYLDRVLIKFKFCRWNILLFMQNNLEYFLHIKIQFLQTNTLDVYHLFLSLSLRRGESICCFVQVLSETDSWHHMRPL